jgi:hypothetical protein
MSHQEAHPNCPNEAYKTLPFEKGTHELSVEDVKYATSKLDSLESGGFPKMPTENELSERLYLYARIFDIARQADRFLLTEEGMSTTLQRDAAPADVAVIAMIDRFRRTQAAFYPRLLNWLYDTLHITAASCVIERLKLIYTLGIREGDKHYWEFCFKGRMKRRTDADSHSAQSRIPSQQANSSLFLIGGINILSASFSASSVTASLPNLSSLSNADA